MSVVKKTKKHKISFKCLRGKKYPDLVAPTVLFFIPTLLIKCVHFYQT